MDLNLIIASKGRQNAPVPVIDLNKCEAHGHCIMGCPNDVFDLKTMSREEYDRLTFVGKIKTRFNGREKAYVAKPEQCHACGLCEISCPEKAITLTSRTTIS